ncbi:tRNA preQ1(34) S-adenosylmethionine ribosyltransferase-isomerase QueA [bacterium]|nr:tRNA preQ1(34) S-adenosylmethionine ribosyltransferase-isomerase QueA [bacterium]
MSRIPKEFKVVVPDEKTAQYPAMERDGSRLLLVDRKKGAVEDIGRFHDIVEYISGDLIVVNDTRVIPANVAGRKPGGGRVDLLFLAVTEEEIDGEGIVRALISPGRRLRPDLELHLPGDAEFRLLRKNSEGEWSGVWSGIAGESYLEWLQRVGRPPLPPYIRRQTESLDEERYQTVYARDPHSLAAPTAGFHFTPELMEELRVRGSEIVSLSLDVGLGTFIPIRTDDLAQHRMHEERYSIPQTTAEAINSARSLRRRTTVVGTTVVRALEDAAAKSYPLKSVEDSADIFIYPPYKFMVVDRLLTNFHRPDSTLLQLMAALIGWDLLNLAYQTALDEDYRFYSYGDAMLII